MSANQCATQEFFWEIGPAPLHSPTSRLINVSLANSSKMSLSLPTRSSIASFARRSPSPSGRSDSSEDLVVAISDFAANLTEEQRKDFKEQQSGLHDADAVFKFTSELDKLDPVRRGRAAASKLCSFLQTVQNFGQVIETLVSSHPEIAALVWGSAKLTFMILINFTSYFQMFTSLLNGFNHLLPQFQEYGRLFPNSEGLKQSVCKFHLAIVSCCTQIVKLTRLTVAKKLWAAATQSFESQMAPFLDEVREAAKTAKAAIDLAKAQDDQLNHKEQLRNQKIILKQSRKSRKDLGSTQEIVMFQANLRQWETLLGKLSSFNHEITYKNARSKRHKGTAEWIFDTPEFQAWVSNDKNAILYLAGKIGSGKTILTANVVDCIKRKSTIQNSISFLFIRFDDVNSQDSNTILRSIVRQALGCQVDKALLDLLKNSEHVGFDHDTLVDLLIQKIKVLKGSFIILDGLDECSQQDQHVVPKTLAALLKRCEGCSIKILISARDSVAEQMDRWLPSASRLIVGSGDTDRDLLCYAREILREKQEGDWGVGDERLIDEILEAIRSGGDGMFLWVFLTIEDICTRRSDDEIRKALTIIPRNLPETFNRVLQRIEQKGNAGISQNIFKWLVAARTPLTLNQIGEVLLIKPNQPDSSTSQRVNRTRHLPSWCENLVRVEDDSETVHFSHHSIQTYLLDSTEKPSGFKLALDLCSHHVGEICLTYLHFSDFQRALTKATRRVDLGKMSIAIVDQTIQTLGGNELGRRVSRLISKPLGNTRTESSQNEAPGGLLAYSTNSNTAQDYPFLPYAVENWIPHTVEIGESWSTWPLWSNMDVCAEYAPWTDLAWQPSGIEHLTYDSSDPKATAKRAKFLLSHRLESKLAGRRWFALHMAIAYAVVMDHKALAKKLVNHVTECQMPLDFPLLEGFLRFKTSDGSASSERRYEDCHRRLIALFTELLTRDDSLISRVVIKSSFSSLERGSEFFCSHPDHRHLDYYICAWLDPLDRRHQSERLIYLSAFRLWSQMFRSEFTENAFATFQADYERFSVELDLLDGSHALMIRTNACNVMIDRGGQWSVRVLKHLFASSELWTSELLRRLSVYVEHALKKKDGDTLKFLLDDKTWPVNTWFRYLHAREKFSDVSAWLPEDIRDRLNEVCSLASRDEDIFHQALLNHNWDIAMEMRESGAQIVKRYGGDLSAKRFFSSILFCNSRRRDGSCVLKEGEGDFHLCAIHRQDAQQAIGRDENPPNGTLLKSVKHCLDIDANHHCQNGCSCNYVQQGLSGISSLVRRRLWKEGQGEEQDEISLGW